MQYREKFEKLEARFDGSHDVGKVRPRIQQPHLGFHGEGVCALLHDAGAFTIVLADYDECAAEHPRGCEIRECIGGHVRANSGLPRDGTTDRIVYGGREHRRRGRLRSTRLEVHAELVEDLFGVGQHIHQVRDRRSLVATNITYS